MTKKCQRCDEEGEDLRTLNMSCFYDMSELAIPFKEEILFDADAKHLRKAKEATTIELHGGHKFNISPGTVFSDGELTLVHIYTLRVCKSCRADWLDAIQQWFQNTHWKHDCLPVGSGIFIRRNGANVEITEEEWYRLNPGREPVRVRNPDNV